MSTADTASDISEGIENTDKVATEIGHAGAFDDNSRDSLEQLQQKRANIEGEHEGLRGGSNWLYAKVGLEPSYEQEIQQIDDAERASQQGDRQIAWRENVAQSREWSANLHMQAQMSQMPANRIQEILIDQQYQQQLIKAGEIVGDPKREAQAQDDALAIKVAQEERLQEQSGLEYANLQTGIRATQLNLAGDPQAAQREQFHQEQANQRVALTQKYGESSDQVKAFDQKSALEGQELTKKQATERQEMESQSARAIGDIQGEAHEAQLRGAGDTYEADRDQFLRTGQDKVSVLHEQASAADDAKRKSLLLAQADAQEKANAQEIAAMDQAHQRQQDSPPAPSVQTPTQSSTLQDYRQTAAQNTQLDTLQNYFAAPEKSATAQVVELGAMLNHGNEHGQAHPTKQAADLANAAARIRDFVAQAHNAGAGKIFSAQQYADSLGASILHGGGTGQALGMASADVNTLGKGGSLSSDLSSVGQKLGNAADKWNHIADQMRNVTILTMGR